jgi:hypothetical protein
VGGLLFFFRIAGDVIFSKVRNFRFDSILAKRSYSHALVPNKYFAEDPVSEKVFIKKGWAEYIKKRRIATRYRYSQ